MEMSHKELARDMFENITDYLSGELAGRRAGGALMMGLVSNRTLKERVEGERAE